MSPIRHLPKPYPPPPNPSPRAAAPTSAKIRFAQLGDPLLQRSTMMVVVLAVLFGARAQAAQPPAATFAHEALRLEAEFNGKQPDYTFLDSLIDQARRKIPTRDTYTQEQAVNVLKAIDQLLVDNDFVFENDTYQLTGVLKGREVTAELMAQQTRPELKQRLQHLRTCHGTNCAAYTYLYLGIGDALRLPLRGVAAPDHLFIRWVFDNKQYFNWETTVGETRTDAEQIKWRKVGDTAIRSGAYMRALGRDDMLAEVYDFRARLAESAHNYARAVEEDTKAIKLDPRCVHAIANRGIFWHMQGELDKALADYNAAIELDSDNPEAFHNRGATWYAKGEWDKALADYSRAIALSPDTCANYYSNRAKAYNMKGAYDKAVADTTRCLQMDPKRIDALEIRAWSYDKLGQTDKAQADKETIQRLRPAP